MIGRDVTISVDGSPMAGYLARPEEDSGPHPAVIVLPEIFGLTPEVRRVTDLLASTGYAGLAIDYYHRTDPGLAEPYTDLGNAKAFAAAAKVTARELLADVSAARSWLGAQPFVRDAKIATWGFDFGATAAFVTSSLAELSGAICFYPSGILTAMPGAGAPPLEDVQVAIPLLVTFGEQDYYVARYDMDRIGAALETAGAEFRMQIYPGVGHAYFRHGRPEAIAEQARYSDEAVAGAVADSWDLVRKFLKDVFSRPLPRAAETGDIHSLRTRSARS